MGRLGCALFDRLDLRLLIHAQNHGFLRRIEIQTHDVSEFLQKARVVRKLESRHAMGLQLIGTPDSAYRIGAHASRFGHGAAGPVGRPVGFGVQRHPDNRRGPSRWSASRPRPGATLSSAYGPPSLNRRRNRITVGRLTPSS